MRINTRTQRIRRSPRKKRKNFTLVRKQLDALDDHEEYRVKYYEDYVVFGKYSTVMSRDKFQDFIRTSQDKEKRNLAVGRLLMHFFDDSVLATSSLSGTTSNASPAKPRLNPEIITDIFYLARSVLKLDSNIFCKIVTKLCCDAVTKMEKERRRIVEDFSNLSI